jgi:eukaryotic-like serine/threonine-protein kinase
MMGRRFMGLQAGGHLGIYEVLSLLGTGGMGEVYRARDTRLNRDVAIKVLPQPFAEDSYRMARFEREAQLLASLNHPNIAAIYGLDESGTTRALVMELVEGPTLAERIGRTSVSARPRAASASPAHSASAGSGSKRPAPRTSAAGGSSSHAEKAAIPVDEALPIARQIAEALEYAHEHGVVHRDLKPANVKLTPEGDVKVLDFGLAKAMVPEDPSVDLSNSPTLSLAMTQAGFIVGTAAYMAPEQAKGKQVDRRADVWAFGCLFYEMLTGQKAFEGETVSDVLAAVIKSEPDWQRLPEDTPPAIRRLIRRCLNKEPKQRLHDMGDARLAIEETMAGGDVDERIGGAIVPGKQRTLLRRTLPWALGSVAIVSTASVAWLLLQPKPRQNLMRFPILPPENTQFGTYGDLSISPDGRNLAFVSPGPDEPSMIWLRPLDSLTAQPLSGTDGASMPFWSPDSRWIGFSADDKLKKVALSGGPAVALCDLRNLSLPDPTHHTTGTWNGDGVILFSNPGGIYRVPDSGGTPSLVAAPDAARNESGFVLPQFLPDGRHFLVGEFTTSGGNRIAVGSLDSKSVVDLGAASSNTLYAPPGYVFYLDESTLMARPFDAKALHLTGQATPVAQNVGMYDGPDYGFFSVSPAGVLAYRAMPNATTNQMTWFNRTGQKLGTVGKPASYAAPALSPDGSMIAVAVGEQPKADIWVYDLKRGTASRLTFNPAYDVNAVWSPDGSQVYFSSARNSNGVWGIFQKAADGLGSEQPVSSGSHNQAIDDLTSDGRYAIYDTASGSGQSLWALPLSGNREPFAFVQGNFVAASAQFSPNGHYVAYSSTETGQAEIYIQTFPKQTGRWEISTAGGAEPMWRHDGKELYYLTPDEKLMAVDVDTGSSAFHAGIPKELFQTQLVPLSYWRNIYRPSADGQRFLMLTPAGSRHEPITVVLNWQALLKK